MPLEYVWGTDRNQDKYPHSFCVAAAFKVQLDNFVAVHIGRVVHRHLGAHMGHRRSTSVWRTAILSGYPNLQREGVYNHGGVGGGH